jgi:hypothetical protein
VAQNELAKTKGQLADAIENRADVAKTILGGTRYTYDICYDHPNPKRARRVAVSIVDCLPRRKCRVTKPVFEVEGSVRGVVRKLRE